MLIRMLRDVSYTDRLLHRGVIYDLPDGLAESMVIARWAEEADQPAAVRIIPADEHAADLVSRRGGTL